MVKLVYTRNMGEKNNGASAVRRLIDYFRSGNKPTEPTGNSKNNVPEPVRKQPSVIEPRTRYVFTPDMLLGRSPMDLAKELQRYPYLQINAGFPARDATGLEQLTIQLMRLRVARIPMLCLRTPQDNTKMELFMLASSQFGGVEHKTLLDQLQRDPDDIIFATALEGIPKHERSPHLPHLLLDLPAEQLFLPIARESDYYGKPITSRHLPALQHIFRNVPGVSVIDM